MMEERKKEMVRQRRGSWRRSLDDLKRDLSSAEGTQGQPVPGPNNPPRVSMFPLSIRVLPTRLPPTVLQTASYVITRRSREVAKSQDFTRDDEVTPKAPTDSNHGMDQITSILDNVDISGSPQSDNFSSELLFRLHTSTHLSSSRLQLRQNMNVLAGEDS